MTPQFIKGYLTPGLFWSLTLCFLFVPLQSLASDLTLSDAVKIALTSNPNLQAANFQTLSAREKMLQARSGTLPQVQVSGKYSQTTNPMWAFGNTLNQESITTQDFDPAQLNDPGSIDNFATVFSVTWPLYDQGQTFYGLQQAKLNQAAATRFTDRTRQQVIAGTITAYIGTLLARENQIVLHQVTQTARSHLKLVQSRYDGGFVAKSDLLRAQVHIADLDQQLAEAESQINIARCRLAVVMGIGGELEYVLSTPLKAGDPIAGSLASWVSTALSSRPDLKRLTFQKQIAQKEIDKSNAARHPLVSLTGNYEINTQDFQDTANNYTIGAAITVPLFTGGRISAKIRQAQINLKQITAMALGLNQQICGETRQAFFNAQSAWEKIRVTKAAVSQSEESLRIVKNRYNSGLFTITDLLDAEAMVQQSLTRQIKAVHDYRAAATHLDLAAGMIDKN